MQFYGEL